MEQQLLSAEKVYALATARVESTSQTISTLRSRPGLASESLDRVVELDARCRELKRRAASAWAEYDEPARLANEQLASLPQEERNTRLAEIRGLAAVARTQPSAAMNEIAEDARLLLEEARGLHALTVGSPLEEKTRERFVVNRQELVEARSHHRIQSFVMLAALVSLTAIAACLAIQIFSSPVLHDKGVSDVEQFVSLAMRATLRISSLAALGWFASFVARQYSRHSQQAVSYTDRLAALDAIDLVLEYGAPGSKEEGLRALVSAYLSEHSNAFRTVETRSPTAAEVVQDSAKILDPLLERAGTVLKALPHPK
jgi:hypothetical protein